MGEVIYFIFYNLKLKGGEANFSFRDFKPDFLNQYLLKHKK